MYICQLDNGGRIPVVLGLDMRAEDTNGCCYRDWDLQHGKQCFHQDMTVCNAANWGECLLQKRFEGALSGREPQGPATIEGLIVEFLKDSRIHADRREFGQLVDFWA